MGRAVLKISDVFVGLGLSTGLHAVTPLRPLRDVKVLDARHMEATGHLELLLEGDDLIGSKDATLDTAPSLDVVLERRLTIEGDAALQLIAAHMRNAEGFCTCDKMGLASAYTCPRCRSKQVLDLVPTRERMHAEAMRRAAGELVASDPVPEDPADQRGEVPGA